VVIREDRPGDVRLIAYYVARAGRIADEAALREHLRTRLPAYMLPSQFVPVASIALTPNGKVDAKALPAPATVEGAREAAAPGSPVERELAGVFADVLGCAHVPADESFFNLGGHSLLLIGVQTRISERLGAEVEMVDFFRYPTIRDLAQHVERLQRGQPAAQAAPTLRSSGRLSHAESRQGQSDRRRGARSRIKDV
jgi:acyl carrier protein